MKRKWIGIILAIIVVFSFISDGIVIGQDDIKEGYTLVGDTVSTSVTNGEIKVTPATLTDSGWVTVEYYSKQLTGNVDASFGFDGKYDIKPSKVESWESYVHNLTRYVPGIVEGVFPQTMGGLPIKIISVKELKEGDVEKVDIGDLKLNPYVAAINYDTSIPFPEGKIVNTDAVIAYITYDEKTGSFTYKYNGQVIENYQETYVDWKPSLNIASKTVDVLSGASDWESLKVPETIKLNTWHKMRFWVDMPFGGLNKVEGKYNIVIKPTGMSLTDAKIQGKLILLDPWYSYSWNYRKSITIAHTDDGAQTNYQMKLLVGESSGAVGEQVDCGAKVASDFDDLRFTTSDGTTLCDYWIESLSGATPNQLATVWIEVPSIAAHPDNTTIYMYYGGTTTAVSSGANTFPFFDDFPGVSIDTDKWQGSTARCVVASSIVTLTSNAVGHHTVFGKLALANDVAIRGKVSITNINYSYFGLVSAAIIGTDGIDIAHSSFVANHSDWQTFKASAYTGWSTTQIEFGAYHIFDFIRQLTGTDTSRAFYDGTEIGTGSTTNVPTVDLYPMLNVYQYSGVTATVLADWILARKYTINEPTWSSFGNEATKGRSFGVIIGKGIVDTIQEEIQMCRNELWTN